MFLSVQEMAFVPCLWTVMGWMRDNKLKLNPSKTEVLIVEDRNLRDELDLPVLDGVTFPQKEQVHSLGMLLNPGLTLVSQVEAMVRSALRGGTLRLASHSDGGTLGPATQPPMAPAALLGPAARPRCQQHSSRRNSPPGCPQRRRHSRPNHPAARGAGGTLGPGRPPAHGGGTLLAPVKATGLMTMWEGTGQRDFPVHRTGGGAAAAW
ncbi:uncharacterized protein LOC128328295 [Hemicordylus capensis]|uniref:uncharacterized protein LOC128328295 n=1 Tax=Hemicordylus capensis TaxID=884348 RepID=UPI0023032B3E|nr:uncharacterized protein LOC128328295 [Hemicordylus capensis]